MKNVISYCRVSTDKQAENGYSLEYQAEAIERYCLHKGYNIVAAHIEDYSAKNFNRPEWKKILSFLKENKGLVQSIVTLRWDRFSRDFTHSVNEIASLTKLGCAIETVEVNIDMTSPEALLTRNIMLTLPQIENEKLSRRTKEGSHKARLNGCWTGTPPRGYVNIRDGEGTTIERKNSTLAFSDEAPIIREAFEKLANGLYSADEVRRWVNSKGVDVSKSQFYNIIRNVAYTGKIRVKAFDDEPEKLVNGLHPALISDEIFAAANDVLAGRKRKMKFKDDKSDLYPLKGHLICPVHGRTLTASGTKKRNGMVYHYYICSMPHCKCEKIPVDLAHDEVEKILEQIQFSALSVKAYKAILERIFEAEGVERQQTIRKIESEIERLNKRKNLIQVDYSDGKLPTQEYLELKMRFDNELFRETKALAELQETLTPFQDYIHKQVPMLEDLASFYRESDGQTKKKILGSIFSQKLHFKDRKVATPEFTTPIAVLLNISKDLRGSKKKQELNNQLLSNMAPPSGLEPETL